MAQPDSTSRFLPAGSVLPRRARALFRGLLRVLGYPRQFFPPFLALASGREGFGVGYGHWNLRWCSKWILACARMTGSAVEVAEAGFARQFRFDVLAAALVDDLA